MSITLRYNLVAQTAADGGEIQAQCDANGNLKVTSGASGATADQVQGNVAAAATDAGNPVKVGGIYSLTLPTLTNGQRGNWQLTAKGAGIVTPYTAAGVEIAPALAAQLPASIGPKTAALSLSTVPAGLPYETVAASSTAQVMGGAGAIGDILHYVNVQPTSTSPGVVTILDNAIEVQAWPGGTVGADLKPFLIVVGAPSVSGPWKITTGANVKVTAYGVFTA